MLTIFAIILPIFLLVLIGYLSVKSGLIPQQAMSGMGRYVIYVALPAVIIHTVMGIQLEQIFNIRYLAAYFFASTCVIILCIVVSTRLFKYRALDASVLATGMVVPNSAFIGYPILLQLLDTPPVSAFAMALLVENLCIVPLCFILMDYCSLSTKSGNVSQRIIALSKRVATNPMLLAIVVGMLGNLLAIQLPGPVEHTLELLAPSAAPVALFVIGGSLAGLVIKETNAMQLVVVSVGKLVVHPLMAALMVSLLLPPASHDLKLALVVITSVPMLSIYAIIGEMYNKRSFCATAQLVATVASVFTIPLMIALAEYWFI